MSVGGSAEATSLHTGKTTTSTGVPRTNPILYGGGVPNPPRTKNAALPTTTVAKATGKSKSTTSKAKNTATTVAKGNTKSGG